MPGPVTYSSDKTVPWNYGGDVYYHDIKQDWPGTEDSSSEKVDSDVSNIAGTSKITRSGRIFSLEIAPPKAVSGPVIIHVIVAPPKVILDLTIISTNTPTDKAITTPVIIPTDTSTVETRGKSILVEHVRTKAQSLTISETSKKEMKEILKIIKRSDYDVVEQLGQTPSKISMLALLLCSEAHEKALVKFLKIVHVPQETSVDQFQDCIASLTADNGLGFSDVDLMPKGRKHNKALHVSVECRGTTLAHVLVDIGSSLNVLPKKALDRLDCEGLTLKPSNIVVREIGRAHV